MLQFIINLFNKNKFEYRNLNKLNTYSFEELKDEIEFINPSIEIKIVKHDVNAFTASFTSSRSRLVILYDNEGKFISKVSEIWI